MWYEKIINWIPLHFKGPLYDVYFRVIGEKIFDDLQKANDEHLQETFLGDANATALGTPNTYNAPGAKKETYQDQTWLDIHAQERGLGRLSYASLAEADRDFQNRIRRIKYNRTIENLKTELAPVIGNIHVDVKPDFDANFLSATGASDRRSETVFNGTHNSKKVTINSVEYGNYGPLDFYKRKNCFSILLNVSIREPHSFFDNDEFFDNSAFYDTRSRTFLEGQIPVLQALIKQKAPAGSGWRILAAGFDGSVDSTTTLATQQQGIN